MKLWCVIGIDNLIETGMAEDIDVEIVGTFKDRDEAEAVREKRSAANLAEYRSYLANPRPGTWEGAVAFLVKEIEAPE